MAIGLLFSGVSVALLRSMDRTAMSHGKVRNVEASVRQADFRLLRVAAGNQPSFSENTSTSTPPKINEGIEMLETPTSESSPSSQRLRVTSSADPYAATIAAAQAQVAQ